MREHRSVGSETRLWLEDHEFETIMETELRKAKLFPSVAEPAVDIECFLEFHLEVKLDLHGQLDEDVLGITQFVKGNCPRVTISRTLTEEAEEKGLGSGIWGRWRATMAHEAAHVILHRRLYGQSDLQESLFPDIDETQPSLMRCLHRDISFSPRHYDWKEFQANRGMASLLMPKEPFTELARSLVDADSAKNPLAQFPEVASAEHQSLLRALSDRCQVSQEAAFIRLETLGLMRSFKGPLL